MNAAIRTGVCSLAMLGALVLAAPASGQLFEEFAGAPPQGPVTSRLFDPDVLPAYFQPPALNLPADPVTAVARSQTRRSRQQLASVPNMFGDFGMMSATVDFIDQGGNARAVGSFDIPGAGGSRPVKIAENGSPLPVDRVFFNYNHYHNVFEFAETRVMPQPTTTILRQEPLDRYTLGLEKTFLDGLWSVELRLPLNNEVESQGDFFAVSSGHWGNLAVIVKTLLYEDDVLAIGAGLGLDTPTGSASQAQIGAFGIVSAQLTFENDALHVLPYVGVVGSLTENVFLTGFLQVDVPTSGDEVLIAPLNGPGQSIGLYNSQALLYVDAGAGCWIYRNCCAEVVTGVAALAELHYTTALQDTDRVAFESLSLTTIVSNPLNRFDVLNASAGLNFELGPCSNLRVAGVFPLGDEPDQRFFDAEVQVQFNRRY